MFCKWTLRFASEKAALWKKVLVAKYGVDNLGRWKLGNRAAREDSSVVRAISKLGNGEHGIGAAFKDGHRNLVGNGNRDSFWKDSWVGERTLSDVFPRLFRAANEQGCLSYRQL